MRPGGIGLGRDVLVLIVFVSFNRRSEADIYSPLDMIGIY